MADVNQHHGVSTPQSRAYGSDHESIKAICETPALPDKL